MELLVWGFGSKIAALQFEWAFQKPHLSRHLKRTQNLPPNIDKVPAYGAIFGKSSSRFRAPAQQMLVLRALLKSEPFCHWGLKVTFFAEWAWAAWEKLEEGVRSDPLLTGSRRLSRRDQRHLPPSELSPGVRCNFTGVDHVRQTLSGLTGEAKAATGIKQSVPKKKGSTPLASQRKGLSHSSCWHEHLPPSATPKGMGLTWDRLENDFPVVPSVLPTAALNQSEPWPPRFVADDTDFTYLSLHRLKRFLHSHSLTAEDVVPSRPASRRRKAKRHGVKCSCCNKPIDFHLDATTWTLCPSPFRSLKPRRIADLSRPEQSAGATAKGNDEICGVDHCTSIFHLACLAKDWLDREQRQRAHAEDSSTMILPICGTCPSCDGQNAGDTEQGMWADVVRSVYRCKEWLEAGNFDFDLLRDVRTVRARRRAQEEDSTTEDEDDFNEDGDEVPELDDASNDSGRQQVGDGSNAPFDHSAATKESHYAQSSTGAVSGAKRKPAPSSSKKRNTSEVRANEGVLQSTSRSNIPHQDGLLASLDDLF